MNFLGIIIVTGQMVLHQSYKKVIGDLYAFHIHFLSATVATIATVATVKMIPSKTPSLSSQPSRPLFFGYFVGG